MDRNIIKTGLYVVGFVMLACGLVLNSKTGLGAAPIASVPYFFSTKTSLSYGNWTLIEYCVLVLIQLVIKGKQRSWKDLLQVVYSLLFTRVMNLLAFIPAAGPWIASRAAYMILANLLTGIGCAMVLLTGWLTNPADSFVKALSVRFGRDVGLVKNIVDISFALFTLFLSLLLTGHVSGIGIGTVIAAVCVGRVIRVFNLVCGRRIASYLSA